LTNRRDIFRGATGLAAAALVGSAIADQSRVALAAGPSSSIVGAIGELGQFEVLSFSWGASNSTSIGTAGGGAGAGKVSIQDLSLTRLTDSLTPVLFSALASGRVFDTASITTSDKKGNPVFNLAMEGVVLNSLSFGDSDEASPLTENISLQFAKVKLTVGTVSAGWDVSENTTT
jgi:type VI secretion system secreted protein Hcp